MHINKAGLNALSFLWKILLFLVESYQDVVITTNYYDYRNAAALFREINKTEP